MINKRELGKKMNNKNFEIKKSFRLNFSALLGRNSKCNLKCFQCHRDYFDVETNFDENQTFSFTDAINMIYDLYEERNNHFTKIHISGHAEPTILGKEKFLKEVIKLRNEFPHLPIVLTTNGSYLLPIIQDYLSLNNTHINLSLHHIAYLKTNWFKKLCNVDNSKKHRIELNIIIDPEIIDHFDELLSFAFETNVNLKFFHRLDESNPGLVISNFINLVREKIKSHKVEIIYKNSREELLIDDAFKIIIKLPEDFNFRPDACRKCPLLIKCVESCWTSIRITPWYIKPCGVRNDNVYFYCENNLESLKNKLIAGGKL